MESRSNLYRKVSSSGPSAPAVRVESSPSSSESAKITQTQNQGTSTDWEKGETKNIGTDTPHFFPIQNVGTDTSSPRYFFPLSIFIGSNISSSEDKSINAVERIDQSTSMIMIPRSRLASRITFIPQQYRATPFQEELVGDKMWEKLHASALSQELSCDTIY